MNKKHVQSQRLIRRYNATACEQLHSYRQIIAKPIFNTLFSYTAAGKMKEKNCHAIVIKIEREGENKKERKDNSV